MEIIFSCSRAFSNSESGDERMFVCLCVGRHQENAGSGSQKKIRYQILKRASFFPKVATCEKHRLPSFWTQEFVAKPTSPDWNICTALGFVAQRLKNYSPCFASSCFPSPNKKLSGHRIWTEVKRTIHFLTASAVQS